VFVRVTQRAIRRVALTVFRHMHSLSLRFHLERHTGGVSRDIERGTRGISTLLTYMLFSGSSRWSSSSAWWRSSFSPSSTGASRAVTFVAVALYIAFSVAITEWRMEIRRQAKRARSKANTRADRQPAQLRNGEVLQQRGIRGARYDENLQKYESAAVKNEASLGLLNIGQSCIIAVAVTLLMILAAEGVVAKTLTLGDLVLVNGLLIQLYIPLNFLGMVYREIKQALADMDRMFRLLTRTGRYRTGRMRYRCPLEKAREARPCVSSTSISPTSRGARSCSTCPSRFPPEARSRWWRERLGKIHSGAAPVPLLRRQRGPHHHQRSRHSRRDAVVPARRDRHRAPGHGALQRHDSLQHHYGRPSASPTRSSEAAKAAHIHEFIESLPDRYESRVGSGA